MDHNYSARFEAEPGESGRMAHVQCIRCRGVHFERESRLALWLGLASIVIFIGISIYRLVS